MEVEVKGDQMDIEDDRELLELLEQTEEKEKLDNKMHQEELIAEDPGPLQSSRREVSSFFKKCRVSLSNRPLGGFESPDVLLIPF